MVWSSETRDAQGECNGFSGRRRKVVVSGGPSDVGRLKCWFCLNGCIHPPLLYLGVHPLRWTYRVGNYTLTAHGSSKLSVKLCL